MSENTVFVGCGVILLNSKGQFLMMKRTSKHGQGTWGLPGGHMEFGETFETVAIREVSEEWRRKNDANKPTVTEEDVAEVIGTERTYGCAVGWGATRKDYGLSELTSEPQKEFLGFSFGSFSGKKGDKFDEKTMQEIDVSSLFNAETLKLYQKYKGMYSITDGFENKA